MLRKLFGAGVLVSVSVWAASASAQFNQGNTTSGLFGQRSVGGSGSLQPSQSSLFGGTRTTSNSTVRSSGVGSSMTTQQQQAGTVTGQERYINANRNAGQSFVGVDVNEIRGVGTVGTGLQGGRGLQGGQFGQANQFRQFDMLRQQFQNFNNLNQQQTRTQVRIALTLGFTPPSPPSGVGPVVTPIAQMVQQRLPRLPGVTLVGTPQVLMEGRTAIVRGEAASERDRELVSRLLLLEPGISSVRNEMTVAQGSAGPGSIPTPPSAAPPEPPPSPPQS